MRNRVIRRRVALALLATFVVVLLCPGVVAAISVPDSGPYLLQIDAYRHLLEDDDLLIVGRYNWPYASPPTETITQTVFVQLLDGDTGLAYCSPYAYYNRGWGYGSFSMYLDASEASGYWEGNLTVEMRGSPTLTWTGGTNYVVTTNTINWWDAASHTVTQTLMYAQLAAWANTLGDYWSVALVSFYADGAKFSSYGEEYFTNVIPGLRAMVPNLFAGAMETPSYTDVTYNTSAAAAMQDNWPFDMGGISEWLGMPSNDEVFRTLIAFGVIFIVGMVMVKQGVSTAPALLACFTLLFVLAVPGFISMILVGGILFAIILMTGVVFLLRRSA